MTRRTGSRWPDARAVPLASLPVAVDAMGGDKAPAEIVAGARKAAEEGIPVVLVGPPGLLGDTGDLEVVEAAEVIGMDEDPAQSVRRKKDSSLVRAAELVRDGAASAMVSAGNTGGAMLLGVDGICVISHGSSSATAMHNAVRVAHELAGRDLAALLAGAVGSARAEGSETGGVPGILGSR